MEYLKEGNKMSFDGQKTNTSRAWMVYYFNGYGEKMPMKNQIHLPSYLTKQKLFDRMKEDLDKKDDVYLSYSRFCRLWKSEFSNVIIPPVNIYIIMFC